MFEEETRRTVHCLVSGRVQGVGFRAATLREAQALGLTGWVRNLADRRVELVATGEPEQIDRLVTWLSEGPPAADVMSVDVVVAVTTPFEQFEIRQEEDED
jgi:acylphosphatase